MPSSYYCLTDDNSNGVKSQELPDGEATCYGFKKSAFKVFIYYICNVITFGLPYLIGRWYKQLKVKFQCVPCPLRLASVILIKDESETYYICKVKEDAVQFLPEEFSSRNHPSSPPSDGVHLRSSSYTNPVFRHFTFRYEKFIWDDRHKGFRKLQGLDEVTCQQLLENFTGHSHSKRLQMRSIYGTNAIEVVVKSYMKLLVDEVLNPFYIFQIFSVVLWAFDDYVWYASCVIIISAISIAVSLVETKRQSEMLRDMAQGSGDYLVTVRRPDGEEEEINSRDIVPGDVVLIPREGCVMPCDAVVINGTCIVNESMLTGESIPVSKSAVMSSSEIFDCDSYKRHTVFCGTQIIQTRFYAGGKVACVVVRTGYSTLKGQLIRSILFPKEVGFQFYSDAMKFVLLLFCLATVGMMGCVYMYIKRNASWKVTIVRVLDVVTIVVPPALPAAMTVGTVYAQSRLKKKSIFCISPPRINFCGKLKLVCFDKTGTLTEDGLDFWCAVPCEEGTNDFSEPVVSPASLPINSPLLRGMASCHSLTYVKGSIVGDPLDLKMFSSTEWELEEPLMENEEETQRFDLLTPNVVKKNGVEIGIMKEFEFTPQYGRMSVAVRSLDNPGRGMVLYCKGAPERIRPLCSNIPDSYDKVLDSFTIKGYRVLAMAWKPIQMSWHQIQRVSRDEAEVDLIFSGFLVMQNSLKPATNPVIKELTTAEIRCVMVTGDNMLTALSVARECGMIPACDKVVIVNSTDEGELEFKLASQHYEASPTEEEDTSDLLTTVVCQQNSYDSDNEASHLLSHAGGSNGSRLSLSSTASTGSSPEPLLDMDRLVPITSDSYSAAISNLHDANYHFILNGRTWSLLQQHCPPDVLELIVSKGTVYARMSPECKRQLVESLQNIGYIVAMCGDGANDCSALKMAHVGISLSEAEASVAAPFTSKIADISCVPHLIREGRCALVTSFGIFKYMALYSMVQFVSVLILYSNETNLSDTQFLYIDLGITTSIAVVMGRTEPYSTLVPQRPMGSLVSFHNVFSILIQILAATATQFGALFFLKSQPWFTPVHPQSGDELITECYETTTIFSISSFQYLILALVFSKGPPFRKPFYTNGMFLATYAILTICTVVLTVYPIGFLATFFHLKPATDVTFRWTILTFPVVNFVVSLALESQLAGSWFVKKLGKIVWKKPKKNRYKEILEYLHSKKNWPPISS